MSRSHAYLQFFCVVFCFATLPVRAVDFLRGDANGDGKVSPADAHFIDNLLFRDGPSPSCLEAADADDNGVIQLTDAIRILNVLLLDSNVPIAAPFPALGPDETPDALGCVSYGGGTPLEDPAAKIRILDSYASGGSDATAIISVAISSSTEIAGYFGQILDGGHVLADPQANFPLVTDVFEPTMESGWASGTVKDGRLKFGLISSITLGFDATVWIPPGEDVTLLEMRVCLEPATPAGTYPLTLEAGELIDLKSGRSIMPALVSGTLTIDSKVEASACPPSSEPEKPNVLFRLEDSTASRGSAVKVPFFIRSNLASQGFSVSVDFDEEVLEASSVEKLWQKPDGTPFEFEVFQLNNENATPGNGGIDEGFIVGAVIISLTDTTSVLPPNHRVHVLDFHFAVKPQAPLGPTQVRFLDGGKSGSGDPVKNKLLAKGNSIRPENAGSFVFVNALVNVLPDGTMFIRGDSNGDEKVDLSDAQATLSYLFLAGEPPRCQDAADANDDGKINISDAIQTLHFLFAGGSPLPPPNGTPGTDPTPDSLGCAGRF